MHNRLVNMNAAVFTEGTNALNWGYWKQSKHICFALVIITLWLFVLYNFFRWYSIVLDELSVSERPLLCLLLLQTVFQNLFYTCIRSVCVIQTRDKSVSQKQTCNRSVTRFNIPWHNNNIDITTVYQTPEIHQEKNINRESSNML